MSWILLAVVYAACATWVVFGLNLLTTRKRIPRLDPRPWAGGEAPRVTIVLPARNEARCLARCLASLTVQDYPNLQMLVVDDQSEDDTPGIIRDAAARDPRIELIDGKPLPAGWRGKCWAIEQAREKVRGDWIFFTDADTWHHPHSLAAAMRQALADDADLLTAAPFLECRSFWEKVVQSHLLVTTFGYARLRRLEDPNKRDSLAYGAYLLVRRSAYDRIGGHAAVKSATDEDIKINAVFKRHGCKVRVTDGVAVFRVHMYETLGQIWEGYSKNYCAFFGGDWRIALLCSIFWYILEVVPWFALPWYAWQVGSWGAARGDQPVPWLDITGLAVTALSDSIVLIAGTRILRRYTGLGFGWVLLHPLAGAVLGTIMGNSGLRTALNLGATWKGRTYASS